MIKIVKQKDNIMDACYCGSTVTGDSFSGEPCPNSCSPPSCYGSGTDVNTSNEELSFGSSNWGGGECWSVEENNIINSGWIVSDPCPEFNSGLLVKDWTIRNGPDFSYCLEPVGSGTCVLGVDGLYWTPTEEYECGVYSAGLNIGENACEDCLAEEETAVSYSI